MKLLRVAFIAAMAFQQVNSPKPAEPPGTAIQGVVMRAGSTAPIPGAHVVLRQGGGGVDARIMQAVTTDNDGKFVFAAVEAGDYTLQFAADGYLTQYFGEQPLINRGKVVRAPGDGGPPGIVMELTPMATITGSVHDAAGKPLSRVPVQLVRSVYTHTGEKGIEVAMQALSNDRGEYRLFWITPGRYYLSAGGSPTNNFLDGRETNPNDVAVPYRKLFFPNTTEVTRAALLDIAPGSALTGLDFTPALLGRYRIRGRLLDAAGRSVAVPRREGGRGVSAYPTSDTSGADPGFETRGGTDGVFEIANVPPGEYRLRANTANGEASVIVAVDESDVDGVLLTLRPSPALNARVEMDTGLPVACCLNLWLIGTDRRDRYFPLTRPDGTLSTTVPAGSYHVGAGDPSYYVRKVWLGEIDVSNQPLTVAGTAADGLRIVLSSDVATLRGTVRNENSEPVAHATVVVVPDQRRDRVDLYRNGGTDQNGSYVIRNIAPGNYKVFAWRSIQPNSWLDPAVLDQYKEPDDALHFEEQSEKTADLRVIPSVTQP